MWMVGVAFASEPVRLGTTTPSDARVILRVSVDGAEPFPLFGRTVRWGSVDAEEKIHATRDGLVYAAEWWVPLPSDEQRASFTAAFTEEAGVAPCKRRAPTGTRAFLTEDGRAYVLVELPGGLKAQLQAWRGNCAALLMGLDVCDTPRIPPPR